MYCRIVTFVSAYRRGKYSWILEPPLAVLQSVGGEQPVVGSLACIGDMLSSCEKSFQGKNNVSMLIVAHSSNKKQEVDHIK